MAKSLKARKTKTVRAVTRTSKLAKLNDERHIGEETTDFSKVPDPQKAIRETLRHYGYFYDYKDGVKWARIYVKANYTKPQAAAFAAAPDWKISMTLGSFCKMATNGAPLEKATVEWMKKEIDAIIETGRKVKNREVAAEKLAADGPVLVKKTIADILKEKTSDFIAEIEGVIDQWGTPEFPTGYSVYTELTKAEAANVTAKAVGEYYTPLYEELKELVTKKTDDLVEGYQHLSLKQQKEKMAFIKSIIDDAEKFQLGKKAVRKPRAAKKITADAQVKNVKYLPTSSEYKVTSVDPTQIVGATEVVLFNVKYKQLALLVANSAAGFTIKGTTIQDYDAERSFKKSLRKPHDQLPLISKATRARINVAFGEIKTVAKPVVGRINQDTIILKTYR